jgi:hypothetical protein
VCAPPPLPEELDEDEKAEEPWWRHPVANCLIVGLTAILTAVGLGLSFSFRTNWWAAAFLTWSAHVPAGLATLLAFHGVSGLEHFLSHCCDIRLAEFELQGSWDRFELLLGFGNAATLQLLGVFLFVCSWRVRRLERAGSVSLPGLP